MSRRVEVIASSNRRPRALLRGDDTTENDGNVRRAASKRVAKADT
ncbi:MAG: hypothetical protein AAF266_00470 [Planctomycetota bacterium]